MNFFLGIQVYHMATVESASQLSRAMLLPLSYYSLPSILGFSHSSHLRSFTIINTISINLNDACTLFVGHSSLMSHTPLFLRVTREAHFVLYFRQLYLMYCSLFLFLLLNVLCFLAFLCHLNNGGRFHRLDIKAMLMHLENGA